MMRNKEVKGMLFAMLLITLAGTAAAYSFSPAGAVVTCSSCILISAIFLLFTAYRYKHLTRLSDYLKRVNGGDYALELPDNDEGELSILKSEIYKVTVSLRAQNERLKQDKLQLADSLSDISHQFKTPLTSISVMADLLSDDKLDEGRRATFTEQLRAQLERLKWLTEALLKLSRLDADAVTFHRRYVPLRELIEKAGGPLLIPIELKDQTLILEADGGDLCCDLNWTAEALTNILKNCMEHTPAGGKIRISASTNALFTEIRVQDSGPGLDKANLPFIFDRFYKGKNAAKDSVGIGLAMAKAILNAQGGSLEAGNAHGGGAEFILRFPMDKAQ
ncbi:two-component sensor histidine kinase [Candidatus Formimonas warabiya]|uniref:histidine kinase n=1 Tax=Formimonas warabiya TaxID=1761012 RepID=A0A3G1L1I8_FORW1|nr:two-component sensor histidine kinase [Candidatus Formimonas warabiya]